MSVPQPASSSSPANPILCAVKGRFHPRLRETYDIEDIAGQLQRIQESRTAEIVMLNEEARVLSSTNLGNGNRTEELSRALAVEKSLSILQSLGSLRQDGLKQIRDIAKHLYRLRLRNADRSIRMNKRYRLENRLNQLMVPKQLETLLKKPSRAETIKPIEDFQYPTEGQYRKALSPDWVALCGPAPLMFGEQSSDYIDLYLDLMDALGPYGDFDLIMCKIMTDSVFSKRRWGAAQDLLLLYRAEEAINRQDKSLPQALANESDSKMLLIEPQTQSLVVRKSIPATVRLQDLIALENNCCQIINESLDDHEEYMEKYLWYQARSREQTIHTFHGR
jgi:hypothetical protein